MGYKAEKQLEQLNLAGYKKEFFSEYIAKLIWRGER